MIEWVHPAGLYILGALLIPLFKGRMRQGYLLLVTALAVFSVASMSPGTYGTHSFIGQTLIFGQVDKLSLLFAWVFTIMGLIGTVYALHVSEPAEHMAAFFYVGSSLGVVFAGDFLTLVLFWEVMAFTSAYLIFAQRGKAATGAGFRYLLVHITGGVLLLAGVVLHYAHSGSLLMGPIDSENGLAYYLVLASFLLNAAVPPLNAWLTDAYPQATVSGTVFLSVFTTKTAVYVLLRLYPGTELLVWLGSIMALYGVIYTLVENDCRRLLSYHIVSQVGYMVAGVGLGTELAQNGAGAHAFTNILYKGLLLMAAGAVIQVTGKRKLTELGGLYRSMPLTLILYMVGALSISAFPLFSGFVSKSLVLAAAGQDHRVLVSLMLTMAAAGTFLSIGLKLPYQMFFGRDVGLKAEEPPSNMLVAMGLAAFLCIAIGVVPGLLYGLLPYPVAFEPYTGEHVTGSLNLLLFTALGFWLLHKRLDPQARISLDTDWFYRKGARGFLWFAHKPFARYEGMVSELANTLVLRSLFAVSARGLKFDLGVIDGVVNGLAGSILRTGQRVRRLQTGQLGHYALGMVVGLVLSLAIYMVV
jgi:multicomponent Na+:H+ antiporter subunit D